MSICVAFGYRPQEMDRLYTNKKFIKKVKDGISNRLVKCSPTLVYTALAPGFDHWVAEICIENNIPFVAAIPFKDQELRWPPKCQEHYKWLLSKALKVIEIDRQIGYISAVVPPGVYEYTKRSRAYNWMIDQIGSEDSVIALHLITDDTSRIHTALSRVKTEKTSAPLLSFHPQNDPRERFR